MRIATRTATPTWSFRSSFPPLSREKVYGHGERGDTDRAQRLAQGGVEMSWPADLSPILEVSPGRLRKRKASIYVIRTI
jgi:hypothetical protein